MQPPCVCPNTCTHIKRLPKQQNKTSRQHLNSHQYRGFKLSHCSDPITPNLQIKPSVVINYKVKIHCLYIAFCVCMSKKALLTPQNSLLYVTKHFRYSDAETSALMLQHTYTHVLAALCNMEGRCSWSDRGDFASCFLYQAY